MVHLLPQTWVTHALWNIPSGLSSWQSPPGLSPPEPAAKRAIYLMLNLHLNEAGGENGMGVAALRTKRFHISWV